VSSEEPPVARRNALRQLAAEARQEAALLSLSDPQHAFYTGVAAAAEDQLHPAAADIHDEKWLAKQVSSFREGYLKTLHVIGGSGPETVRLLLPSPDHVHHGRL
jgi:hypothetical protein